jgi:hypothetical protein
MKNLLTAIALILVLSGSPRLFCADGSAANSSDPAAKTEKAAKRVPFRGKISAVDVIAKTFTLEGKEKPRTFRVTADTRLKKDGKDVSFDDLKVGEILGGQYREGTEGKLEAITVNIGAKAEKEKGLEKSDTRSKP